MAYFPPQIRRNFENRPFVPNSSYQNVAATPTFLGGQGNLFWVHLPPRTIQIEYYLGSISSPDEDTVIWDESDYVAHLRSTQANSSQHRTQTALTEETIMQHLKKRNFVEVKDNEEGPEICVVCQGEYEENESVGILRCGHEYHVDCITKWLLQKNVCPICKAEALQTNRRNDRRR
ncbi:unnamed protein product [Fraxinus pennsylvanica]|uniref:RING-type E3 ubiquitin transferase n=1 Tax=Fraxinus pennsylvanica TaxID=56036 RepID=A0AAD2AFA2_9LAMI|nr:unnamed protein product [Fraxinus pennsylvanica]